MQICKNCCHSKSQHSFSNWQLGRCDFCEQNNIMIKSAPLFEIDTKDEEIGRNQVSMKYVNPNTQFFDYRVVDSQGTIYILCQLSIDNEDEYILAVETKITDSISKIVTKDIVLQSYDIRQLNVPHSLSRQFLIFDSLRDAQLVAKSLLWFKDAMKCQMRDVKYQLERLMEI